MATDAGAPINVPDFAADLDNHETRIGAMEPVLSATAAHTDAIESALVGFLKSTDPFTQFIWKADSSFEVTDGSGRADVAFSEPFPTGCLAVIVSNGDQGTAIFFVGLTAKSASGFTFQCDADSTGSAPVASAAVRVDWIAIGT
jgi:hypothetical protein